MQNTQQENRPAAGCWTILTGPPGAGKSTIAELVASDAIRPTVHLHTDSFYTAIRTGFIAPYLPEAESQNLVVLRVIADAAAAYALGGYDVVLDGIIGPWYLDSFVERARGEGIALSYVVLRPPLDVVIDRATRREGRALRAIEPIAGLHGAFADLGPLEHYAIDTAGQRPAETAEILRARIASGDFLLGA